MIIIFFGPQGCGKGTQSKILSKRLNIPHISLGDLFRSLKGEMKEKINSIINKGNLVPDEIALEVLRERISIEDCKEGFILDGFPRSLNQAKMLDEIVFVDKVIEIYIPDDEAIKRISGRRICPKCKFNFNIYTEPKPKLQGICDFCGTKLVQRDDDFEEAVKKRLEIYHKETEPVLNFYGKKVYRIDGIGTIEEVAKRIGELFKI